MPAQGHSAFSGSANTLTSSLIGFCCSRSTTTCIIQTTNHKNRFVFVVDALDEAYPNFKNALLELIALDVSKLPSWLALLATTQPNPDVKVSSCHSNQPSSQQESMSRNAHEDARIFVLRVLTRGALRGDNERDVEAVVEQVATKSEELFKYPHQIGDKLIRGAFDVDARPDRSSRRLQGAATTCLGQRWPRRRDNDSRSVLEVIVAALVPLHVEDELS